MMWIQIFHSLHSSNEQEMIKEATASVLDHIDKSTIEWQCQSSNVQREIIGIRPPTRGFKVTWRQTRTALLLWVYLQSCERAQIGENNSPGVTQDYIHAGKIDGKGKKEGRNDEAFHCHQSISLHPR